MPNNDIYNGKGTIFSSGDNIGKKDTAAIYNTQRHSNNTIILFFLSISISMFCLISSWIWIDRMNNSIVDPTSRAMSVFFGPMLMLILPGIIFLIIALVSILRWYKLRVGSNTHIASIGDTIFSSLNICIALICLYVIVSYSANVPLEIIFPLDITIIILLFKINPKLKFFYIVLMFIMIAILQSPYIIAILALIITTISAFKFKNK